MKVYMEVTSDIYELPIAVAHSPKELAMMTNTRANNILSSISHLKSGNRKKSKYQVVEIGDLEDE